MSGEADLVAGAEDLRGSVVPEIVKQLMEEVARLRAAVARAAAAPVAADADFKLSSVLDPIHANDRLEVVRALGALKAAAPHEVERASSAVERLCPGLLDGCAKNSARRGKSLQHSLGASINYLTARGI